MNDSSTSTPPGNTCRLKGTVVSRAWARDHWQGMRFWTEADHEVLDSHIPEGSVLYCPASGKNASHLTVHDETGQPRFYIGAGRLEWWPAALDQAPPGTVPGTSEGARIIPLSRRSDSQRGPIGPEETLAFCPNHPTMALPASGICDDCD